MTMLEISRPSYEDARYKAAQCVMGNLRLLAGSFDYMNRKMGRAAPPLLVYFSTHDERLDYKALLADRAKRHGVAYVEHYANLLQKFCANLERQASFIEGKPGI